jgi:hypothetical protein
MMKESRSVGKSHLSSSTAFWLVIVTGIAILERFLVVLFYQPVTYSDTPSYRRLADTILQGFNNYDGTRTPGYPVYLALTGTDQHAWLVQLIFGFLTTLLFFYLAWKLSGKPWFGGMVALVHTLNLGQLFFESNLLTESITTFFVVVTMVGMLVWLYYPKSHTIWVAFLLGLISVITVLIRPLFIYLPFLLLVFLWLDAWLDRRHSEVGDDSVATPPISGVHRFHWRFVAVFLIPVAILLGGWVGFIHTQFDEWSLTTMTGFHLVQHTGNFFEYVPDEYASLRDTYIKYRDAHIAQFGTQTNAIWDAIPEMSQVSGYSFYALSRVLARISIQLIIHHPLLFIKSAISGWWMFWRAPVYWSADAVKLQAFVPVIKTAIKIQRPFIFLTNIVFILSSLYFIIIEAITTLRHRSLPLSLRFNNPAIYRFSWMLLANIWFASILQTLLDHGDNPRFLVPLQSLVVLWVAVFAYKMITTLKMHTSELQP